ncbi:MAG: nucleotide exchange factor GrpE [Candidatus Zixiibacteriota bacterium]|nr:MAG: nucleotide exchange factor GrpE [candidate division Zixibacteria bacterium]
MADKNNPDMEQPSVQGEDQSQQQEAEEILTDEQAEIEDEDNSESVPDPEVETEPELSEEEKLSQRVAELEDKLLRSAAEFENYKKRMARNYENLIQAAGEGILTELLDVIDSFERALQHDENNTDLEAFQKGTKLILNQMIALLEKHDVTPIKSIGEKFDPNLHEALMQVPSEKYKEGIVAVEINKGYLHGKQVLRHAKVGVSSGKPEKDSKETDL